LIIRRRTARGRVDGRRARLSPDQVALARRLNDAREHTVQQNADMLAVKPENYLPITTSGKQATEGVQAAR
jgi:hypothetical protein